MQARKGPRPFTTDSFIAFINGKGWERSRLSIVTKTSGELCGNLRLVRDKPWEGECRTCDGVCRVDSRREGVRIVAEREFTCTSSGHFEFRGRLRWVTLGFCFVPVNLCETRVVFPSEFSDFDVEGAIRACSPSVETLDFIGIGTHVQGWEDYVIPRTGREPLRFTGRVLGVGYDGKVSPDGKRFTVYKTALGRLICRVDNLCGGKPRETDAEMATTACRAFEYLRGKASSARCVSSLIRHATANTAGSATPWGLPCAPLS